MSILLILEVGLDIKFVTTEGLERPTPANSKPLQRGDDEGRGSLVYFNEATMYQSSETNSATLGDAKKAGHSGKADYGNDVQKAFQNNVVHSRLS